MLVAQMDAMVTPLGPMSGDTSELEREIDDCCSRPTRAPTSRARFASRPTRCGAPTRREIIVVSDGALGAGGRRLRARSTSATRSCRIVKVGKGGAQRRRHAVLRAPLPARQEPLRGDARGHEHRRPARGRRAHAPRRRPARRPDQAAPAARASACRASTRASRARAARSRRSIALADGTHDDLPADDHAYALLPERRRAKVLVVTEGNTYLEAALLLDEYLDVTDAHAGRVRRAVPRRRGEGWTRSIFDRRRRRPSCRAPNALYLDPRGPGSPVKVGRGAHAARLRQDRPQAPDRALPGARRRQHREGPQARPAERATRSSARREEGRRSSSPGRAAGTSSSRSASTSATATSRCAWRGRSSSWTRSTGSPTRTRSYLSSFRTGDVWRIPVAGDGAHAGDAQASRTATTQPVPVHEGRAVYLGEHAGFYELSLPAPRTREAAPTTAFAANLLDAAESAIAPATGARGRRQDGRARRGLPRRRAARDLGSTCCSIAALLTRDRVGDLPPEAHRMSAPARRALAFGALVVAIGALLGCGRTCTSSGTRARRIAWTSRGEPSTSSSRRGCSGSSCSCRTSSGCSGGRSPTCRSRSGWSRVRPARRLPRAARARAGAAGADGDDAEGLHRLPRRCVGLGPGRGLEDARAEIQKGLDAKPDGRPRPRRHVRAPPARRPPGRRREADARDRASRRARGCASSRRREDGLRRGDGHRERDAARVRPLPCGVLAARGHPLRRRADRRRSPRRGEPRAALRREGVRHPVPPPRPGRGRRPRPARPRPAFAWASRSTSTRRSSRAAPQTVQLTLKQGEAINGLDGVRSLDLKAGDNDVAVQERRARRR